MNRLLHFLLALLIAAATFDPAVGSSAFFSGAPQSRIYLYAHANPVNNTDPSGHESLLSISAVSGIMGFVNSHHANAASKILYAAQVMFSSTDTSFNNSVNDIAYGLDVFGVVNDSVAVVSTGVALGYGMIKYGIAGARTLGNIVDALRTAPRYLLKKFAGGEETIKLYRAISRAELLDIADSGLLRSASDQMGSKWFAESADDAARWGRWFYGQDRNPFFTLEIEVPKSLAEKMGRDPNLDWIGPARSADDALLREISGSSTMNILSGNVVPN